MRHTPLLLALVAAVAAGSGFLAGRVTAPFDSPVADDSPAADIVGRGPAAGREGEPASATEGERRDAPRRRPTGTDGVARPTSHAHAHAHGDGELTAAELLARLVPEATVARRTEADQLARTLRGRAESAASQAANTAARQIADAIAKERAFLADQARGGTMTMLRSLESAGTHPFDLVADSATFAKHFVREVRGPDVEVAFGAQPPLPEPGTTLRFPAGLHTLSVSSWGRGGAFPADLVIVGAGRDRTVVRFDEFHARGEVRNLTFRDLTIDAGNDYLTDLRSEDPVTIRMERCRVVGFDMGAGGSLMLAARTAAFDAEDTIFEAGWGSSPGSGNLFRVGKGLLARMERCTFIGPFRSVYDANDAATYVFDSCHFVGVTVPLDAPPSGVRFVNCDVVAADADEARPDPSAWMAEAMLLDETGAILVDGVAGTVPEGATGPVVVAFPAGQHTFVAGKTLGPYRGPLVIRGQGKDATLLRVGGQPQVSHLVVRDATIDLGHSSIVGSSVPLAALERVRLVRWDSGAGGSTAFDLRSNRLVVLRDCEVLDGFGRAPGRGTFASLGGGCTLRVERSRIDLAGSEFFRSGGSLVLVDSVVTGVRQDARLEQVQRSNTLRLLRTTLTPLPAGFEKTKTSRPLSDLNGSWTDDR